MMQVLLISMSSGLSVGQFLFNFLLLFFFFICISIYYWDHHISIVCLCHGFGYNWDTRGQKKRCVTCSMG